MKLRNLLLSLFIYLPISLAASSVPAPAPESPSIPVRVSALLGRNEVIKLDDTEPLSAETYGELLDAQEKSGDPMILARVVTYDNGNRYVHYYNAFLFNEWRFGQGYPLSGALQVKHNNNPTNRLPIVGDIQYFTYDPTQPAQGFQYAFSESDFRNNPETRLLIDAHQSMREERRNEARKRQAGELVEAPQPQPAGPQPRLQLPAPAPGNVFELAAQQAGPIEQERARELLQRQAPVLAQEQWPAIQESLASRIGRAKEHLRRGKANASWFVTRQDFECAAAIPFNPDEQAGALEDIRSEANWRLGDLYLSNDHGVSQDFKKAMNYYERALALPHASTLNRAIAAERIAEMWFKGQGVPQNYVEAANYYKQAIKLSTRRASFKESEWANLRLGVMYANGWGVPRDRNEAHGYYARAVRTISQAFHPAAIASAYLWLGENWLNQGALMFAYNDLTKAAQQDVNLEARDRARSLLAKMAKERESQKRPREEGPVVAALPPAEELPPLERLEEEEEEVVELPKRIKKEPEE